jgi:hypothetical protein
MTITQVELRLEALRTLKVAAESVRNLGSLAVDRPMHNLIVAKLITIPEMLELQSQWNGVSDHLDKFIDIAERIFVDAVDDAWCDRVSRDMEPEPHGARDTFVPKEACVPSEGPEPEQFNSLQD